MEEDMAEDRHLSLVFGSGWMALGCIYLNIYISSVHMLVDKLLLNGSTDFDKIFCVSSGGFHNGLDKQFGPI